LHAHVLIFVVAVVLISAIGIWFETGAVVLLTGATLKASIKGGLAGGSARSARRPVAASGAVWYFRVSGERE
jgi:hypothetical protein